MTVPDQYRGGDAPLRTTSSYAAVTAGGAPADRVDLRAFLAMFRRRLGLFIRILLLTLALALLVTLLLPRLYAAEADVVIQKGAQLVPSGDANQPVVTPPPPTPAVVLTELELLSSRDLAERVFAKLDLGHDQVFMDMVTRPHLKERLAALFGTVTPKTEADRHRDAIDQLVNNIAPAQIGTSNAIRVIYTDPDAERAARIANGYATSYAHEQIDDAEADNRKAVALLGMRMHGLQRQALDDYAAAQRYRIKNNLLSANATSLTEQEISTYNQQVALARSEVAENDAALRTARTQLLGGAGNVGSAAASPVIEALRGQRAQLSARVTDLSNRYLDTHPDLISARSQLADLDAQIVAEVGRTLRTLEAKAASSQQRLDSLLASLGSARGTLRGNNGALVTLDDLDRRAKTSQDVYESYLDRYKQTVAQSGAEQADARVISVAAVPLHLSSPSVPLCIALGLLMGLVLGTIAVVVVENTYRGLTTGEDVEDRIGVRYLGAIPEYDTVDQYGSGPMITVADFPGGTFAEAVRNVVGAVRQGLSGRGQVIAITSALPSEGKTTLAACMVRAVALRGERAVLIDCDAIRRRLSQIVQAGAARPGLREVLQDGVPFERALMRDARSPAMVIPITSAFGDTDRLMEQGALHRLVARLREEYDFVILDCPPLLPVAEARELVTLADKVVLAAQWRKTPDYAVRSAIKLLPAKAMDGIGLALTRVDMRQLGKLGLGDSAFIYAAFRKYHSNTEFPSALAAE